MAPSKLRAGYKPENGLGQRLIVSLSAVQRVRRHISCVGCSSALTFSLYLFSLLTSGHNPNITLHPPHPTPSAQSNIPPKAQSKQNLSLYCFALQSQTPISALAHVRETVHVAKCLNPPLLCLCCLGLAIPLHSLSAIYIWVSKFFHCYTV